MYIKTHFNRTFKELNFAVVIAICTLQWCNPTINVSTKKATKLAAFFPKFTYLLIFILLNS